MYALLRKNAKVYMASRSRSRALPAIEELKGKTGKLESLTKMCLFVGYPEGTRGGLFYSPQDKKVFVTTNATFLENTYMTDFKPRSKTV